MATEQQAPRFISAVETLTPEDFETASIRSAAPSYTSEAPSYHSTVPATEPIPSYTAPERSPAGPGPGPCQPTRHNSAPTLLPRGPTDQPTVGLPPIPPAPIRRQTDLPTLSEFRIPTWSSISSNPTARHYHSVAQRRAKAAESSASSFENLKRIVLERIEEEEKHRVRPLEDPFLVGEVAARRAREERLARRENGDEGLVREDLRWGFLGSFARPSNLPSRYLRTFKAAGNQLRL